jgi:hypothetical protein
MNRLRRKTKTAKLLHFTLWHIIKLIFLTRSRVLLQEKLKSSSARSPACLMFNEMLKFSLRGRLKLL